MENKMRKWINLFESVIKLEMRYGVLPVWKNPSAAQTKTCIAKFGLLRGMTDPHGDLYIWEAIEASHDDVDEFLSLDAVSHRFLMDAEVVTTQYADAEQISALPALKRAYGKPFEVVIDKIDW